MTACDFQFFPEIHHASPPVSEFVDDWTNVMAFAGAAGVRLDRLAAVSQSSNRRVVAAETSRVGGSEKLRVSGCPENPVCSRKQPVVCGHPALFSGDVLFAQDGFLLNPKLILTSGMYRLWRAPRGASEPTGAIHGKAKFRDLAVLPSCTSRC